jgi:hypothetical protein
MKGCTDSGSWKIILTSSRLQEGSARLNANGIPPMTIDSQFDDKNANSPCLYGFQKQRKALSREPGPSMTCDHVQESELIFDDAR